MTTATITPTKIKTTSKNQVNNRLTITIDDNFGFILSKMRSSFPLLKDTDLVKMAVGGFYNQNNKLFMREPDAIEKKVIDDFITNPDLARYEDLKDLAATTGINFIKGIKTPDEIAKFDQKIEDDENYLKAKFNKVDYV
jgi:hypothetical protein